MALKRRSLTTRDAHELQTESTTVRTIVRYLYPFAFSSKVNE
jgi:hypothetical protein